MKHAIVIAFAAATLASPVRAADTAAQLNAQELGRIQSGTPVAMAPRPIAPMAEAAFACPPGLQWVPAGYIKRDKWRPAGCVRR